MAELIILLIGTVFAWYNFMKKERAKDPFYREFVAAFEINPFSDKTRELALEVNRRFALQVSDPETPLAVNEWSRAVNTGRELRRREKTPDVIFISPYLRTRQTLDALMEGWPELRRVRVYEEERIREQSHGLASLYNDWKVFFALYPNQKKLYDLEGFYWYQWPQGERVPQVKDRSRSWMTTLTRDFYNQKVLAVSHQLTMLSVRANFERWSAEEFQRVDWEEKPINCGVTKYVGRPHLGRNGHFTLQYYNLDLSGFEAVSIA